MEVRDWIFVIGLGLILLIALAELTEPAAFPGDRRPGERAGGIQAGYAYAVADLLCLVNFLEWRRGLAELGLPDAVSWVFAPIGLLLVVTASVVSWVASYAEDPLTIRRRRSDEKAWKWLASFLLYVGAFAGYIAVVAIRRA